MDYIRQIICLRMITSEKKDKDRCVEREKERKTEEFFSVARDRCNKLSTCEARNICCKEREKAKMHYLRLFPLPQQFVMSPPFIGPQPRDRDCKYFDVFPHPRLSCYMRFRRTRGIFMVCKNRLQQNMLS